MTTQGLLSTVTQDHFVTIEKEAVPSLQFTAAEVLANDALRTLRDAKLHKAMVLGNAFKNKVKITFETTSGVKQVHTTIWAATERSIMLKGGIFIPKHAILDVSIL